MQMATIHVDHHPTDVEIQPDRTPSEEIEKSNKRPSHLRIFFTHFHSRVPNRPPESPDKLSQSTSPPLELTTALPPSPPMPNFHSTCTITRTHTGTLPQKFSPGRTKKDQLDRVCDRANWRAPLCTRPFGRARCPPSAQRGARRCRRGHSLLLSSACSAAFCVSWCLDPYERRTPYC